MMYIGEELNLHTSTQRKRDHCNHHDELGQIPSGNKVSLDSLNFNGLYESELLLELMLRHWNHPRANDEEFGNNLLELAAEALRASVSGQCLIEGMAPDEMNLVSAIWFVEWNRISSDGEMSEDERSTVQNWLASVRRAVPGSFCDQRYLE